MFQFPSWRKLSAAFHAISRPSTVFVVEAEEWEYNVRKIQLLLLIYAQRFRERIVLSKKGLRGKGRRSGTSSDKHRPDLQ